MEYLDHIENFMTLTKKNEAIANQIDCAINMGTIALTAIPKDLTSMPFNIEYMTLFTSLSRYILEQNNPTDMKESLKLMQDAINMAFAIGVAIGIEHGASNNIEIISSLMVNKN